MVACTWAEALGHVASNELVPLVFEPKSFSEGFEITAWVPSFQGFGIVIANLSFSLTMSGMERNPVCRNFHLN
jgi:hypothetical protein